MNPRLRIVIDKKRGFLVQKVFLFFFWVTVSSESDVEDLKKAKSTIDSIIVKSGKEIRL